MRLFFPRIIVRHGILFADHIRRLSISISQRLKAGKINESSLVLSLVVSITKRRVKLIINYDKSASSAELLRRARRGDATTSVAGSTDDVRRHLNAARTATHTRLALPLAAESVRSWNVIQRESLTGSSAPRTVGVSSVNGARSRRPTGERERGGERH